MTATRGVYHKMALGLCNDLETLEERRIPDELGGGMLCRPAFNRYEVQAADGEIVWVTRGSIRESAVSDARNGMIEFLTLRAEGVVIAKKPKWKNEPVWARKPKKCEWCKGEFLRNQQNQRYCSPECRRLRDNDYYNRTRKSKLQTNL